MWKCITIRLLVPGEKALFLWACIIIYHQKFWQTSAGLYLDVESPPGTWCSVSRVLQGTAIDTNLNSYWFLFFHTQNFKYGNINSYFLPSENCMPRLSWQTCLDIFSRHMSYFSKVVLSVHSLAWKLPSRCFTYMFCVRCHSSLSTQASFSSTLSLCLLQKDIVAQDQKNTCVWSSLS